MRRAANASSPETVMLYISQRPGLQEKREQAPLTSTTETFREPQYPRNILPSAQQNTTMPPFSKWRRYQVLNSAGRLRFKGKLPGGILWEQHPCDCTYGAWPERVNRNAYFQQLPLLTRLLSSCFIQNASYNSSRCIQLGRKKN